MANKAIIYCRVATTFPVSSNKALDYQADVCKRYAQNKGYLVVKVIQERGSGSKINLGLQSAIKEIKSGKANILIATEPSKLTRKYSDFFVIKDELGQKLEFLSNAGCNNPDERDLRDCLSMGLSEFYQRKISERMRKVAIETRHTRTARS